MTIFFSIVTVINCLIACGCLFSVYRLNLYVESLEKKLVEQIELTENLKQSMKEVIAEDFLQNDGRLKKFMVQNENRNIIFNGYSGENSVEI